MAFLTLTSVQKLFPGGVAAVEDFNLDVARGEFVSFLGPSGCGKTTTLRMIAGFEKPTSGTINVDGKDITFKPPNQRNVGMVFQSYALFPNMTVADNIGFGLKVRKRPKAEIAKKVNELIELMHLQGRADRYPWQMSGGQQQRVALARALAIEPQVLLLDEPLSALDAKIRIVLRKEIRSIQRQLGITTVYVTHDQEEALSLSDRVVVMNEGHIEQIGVPSEIYNFPTTAFVASFVGTLNLVSAGVIDAAAGRVSIAGQEIRTNRAITSVAAGEVVTLALRPEGISLGEGSEGSNRVQRHDRRHQLPRLDRAHPAPPQRRRRGQATDDHRARHVQRTAPDGADGRRRRHGLVPARGVLRARRRRATRTWHPRTSARRCDRPARRHRPRRLRQGRHAHRVRLDVERLGGGHRRRPACRGRPVRRRAPVRDARLRRRDAASSGRAADSPPRRWPGCASGPTRSWSGRA